MSSITYKDSFLNNLIFENANNAMVGGYVYKHRDEDEFFGGSGNRELITLPGLTVNNYNENMKSHEGEYIGVIEVDKLNEFLDLNYKPLKQLTRNNRNKINANKTKKHR